MTKTDELMALAVEACRSSIAGFALEALRTAIEQAMAEPEPGPLTDNELLIVLRFFAGIDLTKHEIPAEFAWHVLKARAALKAQKEKTC